MSGPGAPRVSVIIPTFNRKADVLACVESVLKSTYRDMEVVVVDNASEDGTAEALAERFGGRICVVRSATNLYAGGGRNLGARHAAGALFLFVDSDNVVDPRMVEELVAGVDRPRELRTGLWGPFMYYADKPDRLCWVNGDINLWTSLTWWEGQKERDEGQYAERDCLRVGHIPNVFMASREIFESLGGFDASFQIIYEESDLAERIKTLGYACVLFPKAKTCHKIPFEDPRWDRAFTGRHPRVLYLSVRNRIWFMRRHANPLQLALLFLVFGPLVTGYQFLITARAGRRDLWGLILKGYRDGWLTTWEGPL
jgi:GT2 family glycosyltransferase